LLKSVIVLCNLVNLSWAQPGRAVRRKVLYLVGAGWEFLGANEFSQCVQCALRRASGCRDVVTCELWLPPLLFSDFRNVKWTFRQARALTFRVIQLRVSGVPHAFAACGSG